MPAVFSSVTAGFGQLELSDFNVNGAALTTSTAAAVNDATVSLSITHASLVVLQLADPYRTILRYGGLVFGSRLEVSGMEFDLVQITKSGDTLQVSFEAATIAKLRTQTGIIATSQTSDLTTWVGGLLLPGTPFVAEQDQLSAPVQIGRGSTQDPTEDSWTAIQRVATSAGWRCFEYAGTIYLGSDQFFLGQPSLGTLTEFTPTIQNMDFDYDIGLPIGNVAVTGMADVWAYPPGGVVNLSGMGPLDGQPWLVQDCQRDLFNPQMGATLYIPMTPQYLVNGAPSRAPF